MNAPDQAALPLSTSMIDLLRSMTSRHGVRTDDVPGRARRSLAALARRGFAADVPGGYHITDAGRAAIAAHDRIVGARVA